MSWLGAKVPHVSRQSHKCYCCQFSATCKVFTFMDNGGDNDEDDVSVFWYSFYTILKFWCVRACAYIFYLFTVCEREVSLSLRFLYQRIMYLGHLNLKHAVRPGGRCRTPQHGRRPPRTTPPSLHSALSADQPFPLLGSSCLSPNLI